MAVNQVMLVKAVVRIQMKLDLEKAKIQPIPGAKPVKRKI